MDIAIALFIFTNAFIGLGLADDYLYYDDYDDYYGYHYGYDDYWCPEGDWRTCEGDFCADKTDWIYIEKEVQISGTNLIHVDYDYYEVVMISAQKECAPSLGIKDFAQCAKSCSNITSDSVGVWDYVEACNFLRKGWINSDGTINEEAKTRYNEIGGVSESINECFSKSKNKKLSRKIKNKSGKKVAKKKNNVKKSKKRSGKRNPKKGKKDGKNKKRSKDRRRRKGKLRRYNRGKQVKSRRRPRRDTKENKDKAKEKKKKKKQQKSERKRLLKSLKLIALPSSDVIDQLDCMEWKIREGLESCIEKIIQQRNASSLDTQ